jgi:hypothetical protein
MNCRPEAAQRDHRTPQSRPRTTERTGARPPGDGMPVTKHDARTRNHGPGARSDTEPAWAWPRGNRHRTNDPGPAATAPHRLPADVFHPDGHSDRPQRAEAS